jgi:hypothetical protein
MLTNPVPSALAAASNPAPSSVTAKQRAPFSSQARMTAVASGPACFMAFWSASRQQK